MSVLSRCLATRLFQVLEHIRDNVSWPHERQHGPASHANHARDHVRRWLRWHWWRIAIPTVTNIRHRIMIHVSEAVIQSRNNVVTLTRHKFSNDMTFTPHKCIYIVTRIPQVHIMTLTTRILYMCHDIPQWHMWCWTYYILPLLCHAAIHSTFWIFEAHETMQPGNFRFAPQTGMLPDWMKTDFLHKKSTSQIGRRFGKFESVDKCHNCMKMPCKSWKITTLQLSLQIYFIVWYGATVMAKGRLNITHSSL